jgi:hypothetical protein
MSTKIATGIDPKSTTVIQINLDTWEIKTLDNVTTVNLTSKDKGGKKS